MTIKYKVLTYMIRTRGLYYTDKGVVLQRKEQHILQKVMVGKCSQRSDRSKACLQKARRKSSFHPALTTITMGVPQPIYICLCEYQTVSVFSLAVLHVGREKKKWGWKRVVAGRKLRTKS